MCYLTDIWRGSIPSFSASSFCFKWDWNVAKQVWQEEAREDGIAIGMEKGVSIGEARVLELLESGMSLDAVKKKLGYKAGRRAKAPSGS